MEERYKISEKSDSGHCCFEATVIDTENPIKSICECFSIEAAKTICNALNGFDRLEKAVAEANRAIKEVCKNSQLTLEERNQIYGPGGVPRSPSSGIGWGSRPSL